MLRIWSLVALVVLFQVAVARWSLEREAKRRWQHALTGHGLVQISYFLPYPLCLASLFLASLAMYYLCFYQQSLFQRLFGPLLRPHEQHGLPGAFYFLIGTLITLLLVPLPIAQYAVECLAFADPMAAWVGRRVSSPLWTASASVAGSMACFLTAYIIGMIMLPHHENTLRGLPWVASCVGALVCTVAEAKGLWNDNLSIPILTAAVVHYYLQKQPVTG